MIIIGMIKMMLIQMVCYEKKEKGGKEPEKEDEIFSKENVEEHIVGDIKFGK